MNQARYLVELECFLRTTHADQGGEATFEDWVRATAGDSSEFGYTDSVEYLLLGGDLREKDLMSDGQWMLAEQCELIARADGWIQGKGQIYRLNQTASEDEPNAEYANDWQEAADISLTPCWSKEDSAAAQEQGWDLFATSSEGKGVSSIQRHDEAELFESDNQAVEFVRAQAAAGNPLAIKALRLDNELQPDASAEAQTEGSNQPIGYTAGGFTVGNLATMTRSTAVGTIIRLGQRDGRQTVTLEFAEPQPVDAPEGATSKRFDLDWRSITSTWAPPVDQRIRGEVGKHEWCIGERCEDGYQVFVDDRQLSNRATPELARDFALDVIANLQADGDYRLNDRPSGFLPPKRAKVTKSVTYGDGQAIMVLAADRMGLSPSLVDEAIKLLKGVNVHPMISASISQEACRMNDLVRHDTNLVTQANSHVEALMGEYGFAEPKAGLDEAKAAQAKKPKSASLGL